MTFRGGIGCVGLLAAGCASGAALTPVDAGPSCKIEGAYDVTYIAVTDAGTCPTTGQTAGTAITSALATVTVNGTHADVVLQDHPGDCPGLVDGCNMTALCTLTNLKTGGAGNLALSWTFTDAGFSGNSHALIPLNDGGTCTLNEGNAGARN